MGDPLQLGPTEHLVYHYTKASTALERILESMTIRLGPINDTNDPWEARAQQVSFSLRADDPATHATFPASIREVNLAMKSARVACFCQDLDTTDPERERRLARSSCGWAQDRMWAQYADGHRGVCLCLDREKLLASFRSELADHGECLAGNVSYGDEQYEGGSPKPNADEAAALGPAEYARQYRAQHARLRYFTKRLDWEGEREWRMVLLEDRPAGRHVFVPIAGALAAIIVGHRFSDAYHPCVRAICERQGIRAFKVMYSGVVGLSRYDEKPVRAA